MGWRHVWGWNSGCSQALKSVGPISGKIKPPAPAALYVKPPTDMLQSRAGWWEKEGARQVPKLLLRCCAWRCAWRCGCDCRLRLLRFAQWHQHLASCPVVQSGGEVVAADHHLFERLDFLPHCLLHLLPYRLLQLPHTLLERLLQPLLHL